MDCRRFERLLDRLVGEQLGAAESRACRAHAAGCPACGELLTLATLPVIDGGGELVTSVLAATSGSPCDGVAERLPDLAQRESSVGEAAVLRQHVADCEECQDLVSVLRRLRRELPALAELRPDARFVDDVLARTLPVHVQLRRWWRRVWPRLLHRPRFASEAAFIGLLVLLLVFATPGSPLEAVPRQVLAAARQPVQAEMRLGDFVAAPFDAVRETAAASSEETFEGLVAVRARSASKAEEVVTEASEGLATFWREAASLLGNDGTDAATESPQRPESNEETP